MAMKQVQVHFNYRQQVFLNFVLAQYVNVGVGELDQEKLAPLLKLRYKDAIACILPYTIAKSIRITITSCCPDVCVP